MSQSSNFLIHDLYHWVCNKSNTTVVKCGAGTAYPTVITCVHHCLFIYLCGVCIVHVVKLDVLTFIVPCPLWFPRKYDVRFIHHRKLRRWARRTPKKTGAEPRCLRKFCFFHITKYSDLFSRYLHDTHGFYWIQKSYRGANWDLALSYNLHTWLYIRLIKFEIQMTGRWFSSGTPVPPPNKTDRHDIIVILL